MVVRSNQLDRNLAGTIEKYGFFAEFRQKNQYSTRGGHQFYRGENHCRYRTALIHVRVGAAAR